MKTLTTAALVALACGTFAVPATASRGHDDGPRGVAGWAFERDDDDARPSTRVLSRAKRAVKAADRAEERIDDEKTAEGLSSLKAVRTNLAAALRSTKRSLATERGPASAFVVAAAQGKVTTQLLGLFDGQVDPTDAALAQTLKAALDGRDELVAALNGHDDERAFERVYARISHDAGDELADLDEALADDELTAAARAALEAAKVQAGATKAAVDARLAALEDDDESEDTGYEDDEQHEDDERECPPHRGGHHGPRPPGAEYPGTRS